MGINWGVRFNRANITFVLRFIGALFIPVLTYMGINFEDLTTWNMVGDTFLQFISNPFLVILTVINALNIVPDPTTKGISDSRTALNYNYPKS